MPDIVVKFGGSNLKSKQDLAKVIKTIISYKQPIVVVVSAFYGITDLLVSKISAGFNNSNDIDLIIYDLEERNKQIINENFKDDTIAAEAFSGSAVLLKELKRLLLGVHYIRELPDFLEDEILSYG